MAQKLENQLKEIENSIDTMEKFLNKEDFQDYCDHAYSCISYIKQNIVKLNKQTHD